MRTQNPLVATPCGFKSHRRHHVGMDCAPFKKPSRKAGLFSYRSVIPPSPRETLLRKFSQGPWPPCRAANVQAVYRLRRLFCKKSSCAYSAAPRFPALPGDNALRSIQKARPPGRAFFVVLLSKQHARPPAPSPVKTRMGPPPCWHIFVGTHNYEAPPLCDMMTSATFQTRKDRKNASKQTRKPYLHRDDVFCDGAVDELLQRGAAAGPLHP